MRQRFAHIAVLMADYDEAILFYTHQLGFQLVEDTPVGGRRRVLLAPPGAGKCSVLLSKAATDTQLGRVGDQAGARFSCSCLPMTLPATSPFRAAGVRFVRLPRDEPYGRVAVFEDLCGNQWTCSNLPNATRTSRKCKSTSLPVYVQ